jgi:hypothetical protein
MVRILGGLENEAEPLFSVNSIPLSRNTSAPMIFTGVLYAYVLTIALMPKHDRSVVRI